jgi:hypothetical protein
MGLAWGHLGLARGRMGLAWGRMGSGSGPQKLAAQPHAAQRHAAQPRFPSEARELLAPQAYKILGCVRKARGGAFAVLNCELGRFAKCSEQRSLREATYLAKSTPFTKKNGAHLLIHRALLPSFPPSFLPPLSFSPPFLSSLPRLPRQLAAFAHLAPTIGLGRVPDLKPAPKGPVERGAGVFVGCGVCGVKNHFLVTPQTGG